MRKVRKIRDLVARKPKKKKENSFEVRGWKEYTSKKELYVDYITYIRIGSIGELL